MKERLPAIKIRVKDVVEGKFVYGEKENFKPSYIITRYGLKASRVNIVGTVTDKFVSEDGKYMSFYIDDGTGSIRVKFFGDLVEKFNDIEISDLVLVIGKVKEYGGEVYVNGEIIRKIEDPNYETYRKLELVKTVSEMKKWVKKIKESREKMSEKEFEKYIEEIGADKEVVDYVLKTFETEEKDYKEYVMKIIAELDEGNGVEIEKIFESINLPENILETTITELLESGYVYEPSPGKYKVVKK